MPNYILKAEPGHINLSPVAFRLTSKDYFKCYLDFEKLGRFSMVPYFLCCRAIELALKAIHLELKTQKEIKSRYSHDLLKSYNDLPTTEKILTTAEFELLEKTNKIYSTKEFEYLSVGDAATGYERFPDLDALAALTRKIINYVV